MSKILINSDYFYMPKSCLRCPFMTRSSSCYEPECMIMGYSVEDNINNHERDEYCPLQEVEENENN